MLLSHDAWLRISEVSGLRASDVVDTRDQADVVGRGVSVFLAEAKTGRRQAVMIDDPEIAALLLWWRARVVQASGESAYLFPAVPALRAALERSLAVLGVPHGRGLGYVWHSFRHGGASRAFLAGRDMSAILLRGRWAVESSGRHYIQAGRQLLLGIALPAVVHELARRLMSHCLGILAAPDLAARLRG